MEPLDTNNAGDNTGNTCPNCGQPLPADTPLGGVCPACLLKSGFYSGTAPEQEPAAGSRHKFAAPSVEELQPHFPQLEIIELIGRGGMGAVYKARQPKLNRLVALKILARDPATDARFADRFQREAQALARMNHPNIVTVYDFGEAGGHYYLLMEHVDGLNLRQIEHGNKITPEEALAIVPPICDALQYAHSQGIVHRDIKPENILLDKDGRVKIADFGIAKILGTATSPDEPLTGDEQRVGTPHYMAPEQVEKPTTVDHRADIYSLGVVFYEMLTGELPLGRFAPPSQKVQVDVRIDEIVLRALEKEPELRFQQASEIRTQVETLNTEAKNVPAAPTPSSPAGSPHSLDTRPDQTGQIMGIIVMILMLALGHKIVSGPALIFWYIGFGIGLASFLVQMYRAKQEPVTEQRSIADTNRLTPTGSAPDIPGIKAPAIGLIIAGAAAILLLILLVIFLFLAVTARSNNGGGMMIAIWPLLAAFIVACMGSFVIFGGSRMLKNRNHGLSVASAIIALITPPIGLPFGIWALVALSRRGVEESFNVSQAARPSQSSVQLHKPGLGSISVALASTWVYTLLIAILLLDQSMRNVQFMLFLAGSLVFLVPAIIMIARGVASRWLASSASGRDWFIIFTYLAFIVSLAVIPAGAFALYSVVLEELPSPSGWNPGPEEAIIFALAVLGMLLMPWSTYILASARPTLPSNYTNSGLSAPLSATAQPPTPSSSAGSPLRVAAGVIALILLAIGLAAPLGILERLILLGIIIVLVSVVDPFYRRRASAPVPGSGQLRLSSAAHARLSRTALIGALWALLLPVELLFFTVIAHSTTPDSIIFPIWSFVGAIGKSAVIGTTVLGFIAISQIRRSSGQIYGMSLAIFDALFFPLIALAGLTWLLFTRLLDVYIQFFAKLNRPGWPVDDYIVEFRQEIAIVAAVVIVWQIALWLIRLITGRSSTASPTDKTSAENLVAVAIYSFAAIWGLCCATFNLSQFADSALSERALAGVSWIAFAGATGIAAVYHIRRYPASRAGLGATATLFAAGAVALWLAKPHARDTLVTGTVVEAGSSVPVAAALVTLETPDPDLPAIAKAYTDSGGRYKLAYKDKDYMILRGTQRAHTADALIQVNANGYETAGRNMSQVQAEGTDFQLQPKHQVPNPVTTKDGAITLASVHLHTPGDNWTIALNAHNNTTTTQYLGVQTQVQVAGLGGGSVSQPEIIKLDPGMTNHIQYLNYSLLHKRPAKVDIEIVRTNTSELARLGNHVFLPPGGEVIFQDQRTINTVGDINETLNAAPATANELPRAAEPTTPAHTFESSARVTFHGIGARPKGDNTWAANGVRLPSIPEGFAKYSHLNAPDLPGRIEREFYLRITNLPKGDVDVKYDAEGRTAMAGQGANPYWEPGNRVVMFTASFPPDQKVTTVSIALATGPWETVAEGAVTSTSGISKKIGTGADAYSIMVGTPGVMDGKVQAIVFNNSKNKPMRLVLVDAAGNRYIGVSSSSNPLSDMLETIYEFDDLTTTAEIVQGEVQSREYEWHHFKDVPLYPLQTPAPSPSSQPNQTAQFTQPLSGPVLRPLRSANGAVTLTSARLRAAGERWTLIVKATNHTSTTQYIGLDYRIEAESGYRDDSPAYQDTFVDGDEAVSAILALERIRLKPGLNSETISFKESIFRKRPLDVTFKFQYPESGKMPGPKMPPNSELLLEKELRIGRNDENLELLAPEVPVSGKVLTSEEASKALRRHFLPRERRGVFAGLRSVFDDMAGTSNKPANLPKPHPSILGDNLERYDHTVEVDPDTGNATITFHGPGAEHLQPVTVADFFGVSKDEIPVTDDTSAGLSKPTASGFPGDEPSVSYSNGLRARLIGVGTHPRDGKAWTAAGNPLPAIPDMFETKYFKAQPTEAQFAREFYALLTNLPDNEDVRVEYKLSGNTGYSAHGHHQGDTKRLAITGTFPHDLRQTTLSLGIASGEWNTFLEERFNKASGFSTTGVSNGRYFYISASGVVSDHTSQQVVLLDGLSDKQIWLTLQDSKGRKYRSNGSSSASESPDRRRTTFSFISIPSDAEITTAIVQTRDYEWREFQNIPLDPVPSLTQSDTSPTTLPLGVKPVTAHTDERTTAAFNFTPKVAVFFQGEANFHIDTASFVPRIPQDPNYAATAENTSSSFHIFTKRNPDGNLTFAAKDLHLLAVEPGQEKSLSADAVNELRTSATRQWNLNAVIDPVEAGIYAFNTGKNLGIIQVADGILEYKLALPVGVANPFTVDKRVQISPHPDRANPAYEEASEQTLQSPAHDVNNAFFDLDTGKVIKPPADLDVTNFADVWNWAAPAGVDIVADTSGTLPSLKSFGASELVHIAPSAWDADTSTPVASALDNFEYFRTPFGGGTPQSVARTYTVPFDPNVIPTYAYQTSENSKGVLQILLAIPEESYTSEDDPPPHIRFRYKRIAEPETTTQSAVYAWQSTAPYQPPAFESFFPDDPAGAEKLEALWDSADKDSRPDAEIFDTVQAGLRRLRTDRRMPVLRWFGNKYIWGKSPQHPRAIEIMYHAAETRPDNHDPYGTRGPAIYFGLSVVKEKSPAILRTLTDIAMLIDDPNDLDRIAWGTESQRHEMMTYLQPYLESHDQATGEKAQIAKKILTGELQAFAWATEIAKTKAQQDFAIQLPSLKEVLTSGTSTARMDALRLILRERLTLIMDETFIPAFASAATDPDPRIRREVARTAGERWVWSTDPQSTAAIDLMLHISRDEDQQARYNAVYFGLSTVRKKGDNIVRRLLELAMEDREPNNYQRIAWGLKSDRAATARILQEYIASPESTTATKAREIYKDMVGEPYTDPASR